MRYIVYRAEFVVLSDEFGSRDGFEAYQDDIKDCVSELFEEYGEGPGVQIIVYSIEKCSIRFFLKVPDFIQGKTFMMNDLKESLYERIFKYSGSKEAYETLFGDEVIKTKILKRVSPSYTARVLECIVNRDGSILSEFEIEEFLDGLDKENDGEDSGLNEKVYGSDEDDEEEYEEDELTGIFDGSDDESEEPTQDIGVYKDYMDALVGLEDFKKEVWGVARFSAVNRKLKARTGVKRVFPFHYIFSIEKGMGLTTILRIFTEHLERCGIIDTSNFIEYGGSLAFDSKEQSESASGVFIKGSNGAYIVDGDYGVVAVNITEQMRDSHFKFDKLMDVMWESRGRVVFVLVVEGRERPENTRLLQRIKSRVNCHHVDFPPYTDEEYIRITAKLLGMYGLDMDKAAERELAARIARERETGTFENIRTIQKIIEQARVEKLFRLTGRDGEDYDTIGVQDLSALSLENSSDAVNIWSEFDNIVGLEGIKKKLKEIVANAIVQRKRKAQGLDDGEIECYHMMFTGNPGTGKTTVARILGRLFRQVGVLKKGEVYEVSRDNLVARYVGQTAPLVRERVREALGSVLFIDEAYSLNGGDEKDFGYEAIDILIKEMENRRDELIVILAGYTEDMEALLEMNLGLKERVPYKIEFPDYNADELTTIFVKLLGSSYVLEDGVLERMKGLFAEAVKNASKGFGNGRFARNVVERLKMKHSMRLCEENDYDREDLTTIRLKDVDALYEDEDILEHLRQGDKNTRSIGF